ncbi:MAG: sigma-70 family RNA polymerase sigma factor [Verrucomicrobiaceae bacterium]|nr:MAG: sigma-70 family RNA polymerase sigma factor [Verrucomicrobiaceae bacterium]
MHEITRILHDIDQGGASAENLLPLVYEELRKLAAVRMADEAAGHTLQPTALVHEVWVRVAGNDAAAPFANRSHFFAAAAEAMRRILIDRARRKAAVKRGGAWQRIDLEKVDLAADTESDTLLKVNEAILALEKDSPEAAKVVNLRFFGGLTLEETGRVLGFTERTAKRHWAYARAWLFAELSKKDR